MLEGRSPSVPLDETLLLQYFANEYSDHPDWLSMLTMALEMRCLVIVIDGIDEAAGWRGAISKLIREVLVPAGHRLVCTSRPEGVNKALFCSFVVFDLKPLSEQQQQQAVESQLALIPYGRTFSHHLLKFTEIRTEHDRIYTEVAFPSPDDRDRIERLVVPNLQFLDGEGGARDPQMRQKTRDGKWAAASRAAQPTSKYLSGLCSVLTPDVLTSMDAMMDATPEHKLKPRLEELMSQQVQGGTDPAAVAVAERLALLVSKRKRAIKGVDAAPPEGSQKRRALDYLKLVAPHTTAAKLWPCIVARTDSIYATIEDLLPVFKAATKELMQA
eukprot:6251836-Prymnesium_polylepis.1